MGASQRTVIVEPKREVVELTADNTRTVYVVEPVPTTGSTSGGVPPTRIVAAGTGLAGGGALNGDITLSVVFGTTVGTVAQGNDPRLSDTRPPVPHSQTHHTGSTDPVAPVDIGAADRTHFHAELDVNNLTADLAAKADTSALAGRVPTSRIIATGTGLTGGGDLTADRSLAVAYGTAAGTAAVGNDARIVGAVQASTVTARGDLLAGTGAAALARVPVGSDGQTLVADSGQAAGVKWAAPAASGLQSSTLAFLPAAQETMPRLAATSTADIDLSSGGARLAYLTAASAMTVTKLMVVSGTSPAGATPTLVRFALYSVDGSGNLTQVGATANAPTTFAANLTPYTLPLQASVTLTAGQLYAVAALVTTGAAAPTVLGVRCGTAALNAMNPRMCAFYGSGADLPASIAAGALINTQSLMYAAVVA